jgi:fused signal recognition particle receptor
VFKFKKKPSATSSESHSSWFGTLRKGLKKTRDSLSEGLENLFSGKTTINEELYDELETQLLLADIGVETTEEILSTVANEVDKKSITDPEVLLESVKDCLASMLPSETFSIKKTAGPYVILMVGVNGAGKTTSIAKIAHHYLEQGKKVMLAAGDTFRAAAIDQLQVWGKRNNVPVVAQQPGSDSAAVIFDALESAKAKGMDFLIADTAGRLHTQGHLMKELQKIKRVMKKCDINAPHEVMLILDASMGQNALVQAKQFNEMIGIHSISLTKLDGTAKGGIIFSIANELKLPYRFIGVGEKIDDLKPFNADEFINALFE